MTRPHYDPDNIFAKILKGAIPCKKAGENEHALAFFDIHPQAPIHILVIPKGPFVDAGDFFEHASDAEIASYARLLAHVAKEHGATDGGYRTISNCGVNAHQEVPHFHTHILAGCALGPMLHKSPAKA